MEKWQSAVAHQGEEKVVPWIVLEIECLESPSPKECHPYNHSALDAWCNFDCEQLSKCLSRTLQVLVHTIAGMSRHNECACVYRSCSLYGFWCDYAAKDRRCGWPLLLVYSEYVYEGRRDESVRSTMNDGKANRSATSANVCCYQVMYVMVKVEGQKARPEGETLVASIAVPISTSISESNVD